MDVHLAKKGRLGEVVLGGDLLHHVVREPLVQRADGCRISTEQPAAKSINLIQRNFYARQFRWRCNLKSKNCINLREITWADRNTIFVKMKRICILLLIPLALGAEEALSLRQAVEQAFAANPTLAAAQAGISSAEGRQQQAGLRLNPHLVFQQENLRFRGDPPFSYSRDTDTFAYLQQPIELGGKRSRRRDMALAELRLVQIQRELLRQQIAAVVKSAYWRALGRQQVLDVLRSNVDNFQKIIDYHEIRVREGAMPEADLIRVRIEGERLALSANDAALAADQARIELFRQMGLTQFPDVKLTEDLGQTPTAAPVADERKALEERAEVRAARQSVVLEQTNLAMQKSIGVPDLLGVLGYKRTAGLNTAMAGVQVELPVFDRNQGEVAAAGANIHRAESNLAATEALVRAEVRAASVDYSTRRRQLDVYLTKLRSQANESANIAQSAYREGATDLLRLLDAERTRIEVELLYYETLAAFHESEAALEAAMGIVP